MSKDKMRAEFESQVAKLSYSETAIYDAWQVWQAAYAAGRISVQQEKEAWSKAVNEAFIDSARKSVSDWLTSYADWREAQDEVK